jgi:hypothetical protein
MNCISIPMSGMPGAVFRNTRQICFTKHYAIRKRTTSDKPCLPEYQYPFNKLTNQRKQGCKQLPGEFDVQFIEQRPSYRAGFAIHHVKAFAD